jgi:hypothetical protein
MGQLLLRVEVIYGCFRHSKHYMVWIDSKRSMVEAKKEKKKMIKAYK